MLLQKFYGGSSVILAGDINDQRDRRPGSKLREGREAERLILGEDHPLERSQLGGWLEPELIDEFAADLLERIESLALTSRPVEREHLQISQTLPLGVTTNERLDRGQDGSVLSELEHRFESQFLSDEPELVKSGALNPGEGLICHIRQSGAAPKSECLGERRGTLPRPEAGCRSDRSLEPDCVQAVSLDLQAVSRWPCFDCFRTEYAPKLGMQLRIDANARWRSLAPDLVH